MSVSIAVGKYHDRNNKVIARWLVAVAIDPCCCFLQPARRSRNRKKNRTRARAQPRRQLQPAPANTTPSSANPSPHQHTDQRATADDDLALERKPAPHGERSAASATQRPDQKSNEPSPPTSNPWYTPWHNTSMPVVRPLRHRNDQCVCILGPSSK